MVDAKCRESRLHLAELCVFLRGPLRLDPGPANLIAKGAKLPQAKNGEGRLHQNELFGVDRLRLQ